MASQFGSEVVLYGYFLKILCTLVKYAWQRLNALAHLTKIAAAAGRLLLTDCCAR
jgi:hypothetical protein